MKVELIASILAFFVLLIVIYAWKSVECREMWKPSGMETSFGFFQGCQVKTPKGWMPSHIIREVDIK